HPGGPLMGMITPLEFLSPVAARRFPMPRALSLPQRQLRWERAALGHPADAVAADLGLCPSTVRKLSARFRARGRAGFLPAYHRCGQRQATADPELLAAALDMRRQHAGWGAGLLRVLLAEQYPARTVPCARTLQRYLARAGLAPAPHGRRPAARYQRATRPHQVWQIDAAERLHLGDGSQACWLRLVDECSGAFLQTTVFPPGRLERGAAAADASRLAAGLPQLGPAGALARRQRHPVGLARRPAHRPGVVAGGGGGGRPPSTRPGRPRPPRCRGAPQGPHRPGGS